MTLCRRCRAELPAEAFAPGQLRRPYPRCRPCQSAVARQWREQNPEVARATSRDWSRRRRGIPLEAPLKFNYRAALAALVTAPDHGPNERLLP